MQPQDYLILIVEDDFIIARDIGKILTAEGYRCILNIATYKEAVDAIETASPNLVLIDIMLRKTHDGLRIGGYLFKRGGIPYVYLTSLQDKNTRLEIKQTFPHGYIVKPFKPIDVITNVALALNNFRHIKTDTHRVTAPAIEDDTPFIIKKVIAYINENINEKIQLEDLLVLTRWKKHNFIKMFTQYADETPYQYILRCKLQKCMALMETTDLSAADIAFEMGFNSYSSFNKLFKKNTGMSVEDYKKKIRLSKYGSP
jgi:AraC-like DNA-binding protein